MVEGLISGSHQAEQAGFETAAIAVIARVVSGSFFLAAMSSDQCCVSSCNKNLRGDVYWVQQISLNEDWSQRRHGVSTIFRVALL